MRLRMPAPYSKQQGFTLIEVLIAMLILTVGLMALLQTLGAAISRNFSNKLRSDAVLIADSAMGTERGKAFDKIFSANTSAHVRFALGFVNYSIRKTVDTGYTTKRVKIEISWRDKQVKKSHSLATTISN